MEIEYTKGWKYQLARSCKTKTPVTGYDIVNDYFHLHSNGDLEVFKGYAWDGASGPTFDTKSSMFPSMIHDVFCQCMRDGSISYDAWQDTINKLFETHCKACGMFEARVAIWYLGVEIGDAGNPEQGPDRGILTAPAVLEVNQV